MTKKQTEKIMDEEIIECQKELQKTKQLLRGLEFSVIDVEALDGCYDQDRGYDVARVKFIDNKKSQTSIYLEKHNVCGYKKCEHYSLKLGKNVKGMHTNVHYNSGSIEMEVEADYTYDHFNQLIFTDGKFYFMVIQDLDSFNKNIKNLKEKIGYSEKINKLRIKKNNLEKIDSGPFDNLEERICELENEQKEAKETMKNLYYGNENYKEYILSHIAEFKKYVRGYLNEDISFIQDSIERKKAELLTELCLSEENRKQKKEYSKLFKQ